MPAHDEMNLNSAGAQRPVTDDVPGLPVAGYKPTQPAEAIAAVNVNKHIEEMILRDMDRLKQGGPGVAAVDQRWLAIARTKMEEAFMAYNRAIFQPMRVAGDLRAFTIPDAASTDPEPAPNAATLSA